MGIKKEIDLDKLWNVNKIYLKVEKLEDVYLVYETYRQLHILNNIDVNRMFSEELLKDHYEMHNISGIKIYRLKVLDSGVDVGGFNLDDIYDESVIKNADYCYKNKIHKSLNYK